MKWKTMRMQEGQSVIKLSLYFLILFFFNNVANAQIINGNNLKEKHMVINTFFKKLDSVYLYDKTVNFIHTVDESNQNLKNFRNWDEAKFSLENSQLKKLDLRSVLNQKDLNKVIDSLFYSSKICLNKKYIKKNIFFIKKGDSLNNKKKYSVSLPILYKSKNGKLYSFIYVESLYNSHDGYGALYLYVKKNTEWERIYTYGLWII